MTSEPKSQASMRHLSDRLALAAACVFVFLASYRIELPGLYYDEMDFVNAAQGAPDNTFIYKRLGPVPVFINPYLGALKAWLYAPIFRLFGVSPVTVRLPAILLAAVTLLILYGAMRDTLGSVWAAIVVWIMAVDPANLFPSRLDWGPTVLMHFFQALILALWFSYRKKPQLWKLFMIVGCFGAGFFDKFNFVWFVLAFIVGIVLCYPESLVSLWSSLPKFTRWLAIIVFLVGVGAIVHTILPLLHFKPAKAHTAGLEVKWSQLLSTLSGRAVAGFIFGNGSGIISHVPLWLIVADSCLGLVSLFSPTSDSGVRENRKNGLFCLLVGFLIFTQIAITPQSGGPHHYSMIFPLPLLAFAFLAKSVFSQAATKTLQRVAAVVLGSAAMCIFLVNGHNTAAYLSHFRTNVHYNPRWSPEIYSLSEYVNKHGFEANRIISADWGLHNQLHALAPRKLRPRMRDLWPLFKQLGQKTQQEQSTTLRRIFPEGKNFVLAFSASKETFPETRQNFLASLAAHPELKFRLAKEFWLGGEKIYELYEVIRSSPFPEER
jgi:dolichyl-phosphate-mannose-protein mannosyltransferase